MKNIQDEVVALEVAMAVATDIQGKSYAHAVVRIQAALLGKDVDEAEPVQVSKDQLQKYRETWGFLITDRLPYVEMILSLPDGQNVKLSSHLTEIKGFPHEGSKFGVPHYVGPIPNFPWKVCQTKEDGFSIRRGTTDFVNFGGMMPGSNNHNFMLKLQKFLSGEDE